ncbi:MAG: transglutaminase domain-containing protein [Candidatus Hydrogenedentes bacterium]|nr:transglutaminase domain-containing protein [Candidatus Hydrogenedentota bacterium]
MKTIVSWHFALGGLLWGNLACAGTIDVGRLSAIDTHALAATAQSEAAIRPLAQYLSTATKSDTEKARAIYRWVADRIAYDIKSFSNKTSSSADPETVFRSRLAVCSGYAALFERLAKESGLEAVTITGYAKGVGHVAGSSIATPNHAWNAVKLEGKWQLIDSTWGSGYVEAGASVKKFSETFFLPSPEKLVFSHHPQDAAWQLRSERLLTKTEFESLPEINADFFDLGIEPADVWKTVNSQEFKGALVRTFDLPAGVARVRNAPLSYRLPAGSTQRFEIVSASFEKMAVEYNKKWLPMRKDGDVFSIDIVANSKGELSVNGKTPTSKKHAAVLEYIVD